MRVTANTFPNSLLHQVTSLSQRQNKLQTQAVTGQRVQLPEDDPVSMRRILDMQAESKSVGQYQRNISRHQELATASFNSMKALKNISDRVRELSISADGLKSQDELNLYAKEVTELIKQAVQTANTENRGDYLFSGTLSDRSNLPPLALRARDGRQRQRCQRYLPGQPWPGGERDRQWHHLKRANSGRE